MMVRHAVGLGLLALLTTSGCGTTATCEDTRDLAQSPAGLALTQAEHGIGWGQSTCFQCHQIWKIHQADCVSGVDIDVAAINDQIDIEDAATCAVCHGDNGVDGLLPPDTGIADTGTVDTGGTTTGATP